MPSIAQLSLFGLADRKLRECVGQLLRHSSPQLIPAVQTHDRLAAGALQQECPKDPPTDMAPRAVELFRGELPSESQRVQQVWVVIAEYPLGRFVRKLSG